MTIDCPTRAVRRLPATVRALLPAVAAAVVGVSLIGCGSAPTPTSSASVDSTGAGSATPSAAASGALSASSVDPISIYAAIAADVEAIRGLAPTKDVAPVLVDEARLRTDVTVEFDASNPPSAIASQEAILRLLGLLGPSASLRDANIALLAGQVAGYYDPEKGSLFVVSRSGAIGPTQRATYAHEFTHELQDQHFGIAKLGLDVHDQGDRSLARLALVEGDASLVQTDWIRERLSGSELTQLLLESSDPTAARALNDAPAILRTTSIFPYQDGLAFVSRLAANGGFGAVDRAFGAPPDSTEQILHPEKYTAREEPIAITLPARLAAMLGPGWSLEAQDTLGELVLRTWLAQSGVPSPDAAAAAAGWGGDRLGLLSGPSGTHALVVDSQWDAAGDADEFATAASSAIARRSLGAGVLHAPGSTRVVIVIAAAASDRNALAAAFPR